MESDIKKRRSEVLQQLKDQAEDVREVEEKIYVIGCKLKTVLEENGRFTKVRLINVRIYKHLWNPELMNAQF